MSESYNDEKRPWLEKLWEGADPNARLMVGGLCAIADAIELAGVKIADSQRSVIERIEITDADPAAEADAAAMAAGASLVEGVFRALASTDGPLLPGEPLFMVRGTDLNAVAFVRGWCERIESAGNQPGEVVAAARQLAYEFQRWADSRAETMGHTAPHPFFFTLARAR